MSILLTDEEIIVPNLFPPKDNPDLFLRFGRMNAHAQLKKVLDKGLRVNNLGDIQQGKGTIIFIPDEPLV